MLDEGAIPSPSTKDTLPIGSGVPVEPVGVLQADVSLMGGN